MVGSHVFRKKRHILKTCWELRQLISLGSYSPSMFLRATKFEETISVSSTQTRWICSSYPKVFSFFYGRCNPWYKISWNLVDSSLYEGVLGHHAGHSTDWHLWFLWTHLPWNLAAQVIFFWFVHAVFPLLFTVALLCLQKRFWSFPPPATPLFQAFSLVHRVSRRPQNKIISRVKHKYHPNLFCRRSGAFLLESSVATWRTF